MVAGVGFCDARVLAAGLPVELARFHDDAAQGGAVAAQELRCRVHHDVRAVLDGADQVRRTEGVVNDQRQTVLVSDIRNGVDIRDVAVRVAEGFQVDGPGVLPDRVFNSFQVVNVNKRSVDSVQRQRVEKQVLRPAVNRLLSDDVLAAFRQRLNGVRNRRCAGRQSQTGNAAFQSRDSIFKNALSGVRQTSVNVAGIR